MKISLLLLTFLLSGISLFSQENTELKLSPLNPDFEDYINKKSRGDEYKGLIPSPVNFDFNGYNPVILKNNIPTSYDLRIIDGGEYITSVKDQGNEGACWAFAAYGAIESFWKKNGYGTYDLSEQNMATCHKFNHTPSQGGNSSMSISYLTRYSGPVSENDDPYTLPSNPGCVEGFTPVAYVTEMRTLPGINDPGFNRNAVKQAIMDYGALSVNMHAEENGEYGMYMNSYDYTFYYNGDDVTNHGVTLVGWDDNKLVTGGMAATPSGRGAWIIKNSWGPSWGQNGYFYISYEDTRALTTISYFPSYDQYSAQKKAYYYDLTGMIGYVGYQVGDNYGLVKFTAEEDLQINSVGTYATSANTSVTANIYTGFNGTALSGLAGSSNTISCDLPGYYTLDLNSPVTITAGNDFYIRIKYTSTASQYAIPIEVVHDDYNSDNAVIESGKCWMSPSGMSWLSIGANTSYEYNICVKAYTSTIIQPLVADFSTDIRTGCDNLDVQFTNESSENAASYLWNFGDGTISAQENPQHTYSSPGSYTVSLTVYDESSLNEDEKVLTDYIVISQTPGNIIISGGEHPGCGSLTLTATGGTGGTIYWQNTNNNGTNMDNSDISQIVTVSGTYYFRAENNGCWSNESSADVVIYENILVDLGDDIRECTDEITLDAGAAFGSYLWSTGATTQTISVSTSGNYYVTVTDGNVCTSTDEIRVDLFEPVNISVSSTPFTDPYNANGTATVDVSEVNGPVILWSNGEETSTISGLISGIYFVTVTNIFGCEASSYTSVGSTVEINAGFSADIRSGCDIVEVSFTNSSSSNTILWEWNFGDGNTSTLQSPTHTYTEPGYYTVSLIASTGVISDEEIKYEYIVVGESPTVIYNVTNASGSQNADGSISVQVTGGTPPYNYSWSHGYHSNHAVDLLPGIYTVTVSEADGCSETVSITVGYDVFITSEKLEYSIYPNPAKDFINIIIKESHSGKLKILNNLGKTVYQSDINSDNFRLDISDFASGIYFISIEFDNETKVHKIIIE